MKCKDIQKLLSLFLDTQLTAQQKQEVEKHLNSCPECFKEYSKLKQITEYLKKIVIEPSSIPDLAFEIEQSLQKEKIKIPMIQTIPSLFTKILVPTVGLAIFFLIFYQTVIKKQEIIQISENKPKPHKSQETYPANIATMDKELFQREKIKTEKIFQNIEKQKNNFQEIEEILFASTKFSEDRKIVFRGEKKPSVLELEKKLFDKNLNNNIKEFYKRRLYRYNEIYQMKQKGIITESESALLVPLTKKNTLSLKEKEIIQQENKDRENIITNFSQEYIKEVPEKSVFLKKQIQQKTKIKLAQTFAEIFNTIYKSNQ